MMSPSPAATSARRMQNRDVTGFLTFRVQGLLHLQGASVLVAAEHGLTFAPRKGQVKFGLPARRATESLRQGAHVLFERRLRNRDPVAAPILQQLANHRCANPVICLVSSDLTRASSPMLARASTPGGGPEGLLAVRSTMTRLRSTYLSLLNESMRRAAVWLSMLVMAKVPSPWVHSFTQSRAHCVRRGPCQ